MEKTGEKIAEVPLVRALCRFFHFSFICICLFPVLYKEEELSHSCVLAVHLYLLCQQKNHMLIEVQRMQPSLRDFLVFLDFTRFYLRKVDK